MKKLFFKRKPAVLLAVGSAAGFLVGGVVAWSLLQKRPTLTGMPTGAEIIPQDAMLTVAFSTDKGQWQQLRRFGTPETQAMLDQNLAKLRDQLLTANGMNYQRDVQPWVGNQITAALLSPVSDAKAQSQKIQPYDPSKLATGDQSTLFILPIADPAKAEELLATPKVGANQDWVNRDYKGVKIREVQGKTARAYAATVIDKRFVVAADNANAVERVIDTWKGKPSIAQTPGYSQALSHITATNPFMNVYLNLPAAASNTSQLIPMQLLAPLRGNQGLAAAVNLESEGLRWQGVSWLPPNSKTRFKVTNSAERMPLLLPADSLLVTSGGNLKQSWQNYTQQPADLPKPGLFNPETMRQAVNNLTGLNLEQDLINWMDGEYALAVVSSPAAKGLGAKAGVMLLTQTNDRKAAEQSFQKLDDLLKTRYRFQVTPTQINGKPATSWVSPFAALTVTHGWLDGNVAFLAVGPDLASTIVPAPAKALTENLLFGQTTSADLKPNNGHFFIDLDRLSSASASLPLPVLPSENQSLLRAMRAIGLTAALQDGRTTRYDGHVLLRKGDTPQALPSPGVALPDSSPGSPTGAAKSKSSNPQSGN